MNNLINLIILVCTILCTYYYNYGKFILVSRVNRLYMANIFMCLSLLTSASYPYFISLHALFIILYPGVSDC